MDAHSTPPLFDLRARQLTYTLGAEMLHFNDGLTVMHFVQKVISPYQVVTHHVGEIPAQWMADQGRYECFRAALSIIGASREVRDVLVSPRRSDRNRTTGPASRVDGPTAAPSWWVES